jgi:hypothetical protein
MGAMELTYDFTLDGKTVTGRCTFAAINAFEDRTDISISEAFTQLGENKIKFSTIAAAVWAFVNGERVYRGEKPLPFDAVGSQVHKDGFMSHVTPAMKFLLLTMPKTEQAAPADDGQKKSSESTGLGSSVSASGDGT